MYQEVGYSMILDSCFFSVLVNFFVLRVVCIPHYNGHYVTRNFSFATFVKELIVIIVSCVNTDSLNYTVVQITQTLRQPIDRVNHYPRA